MRKTHRKQGSPKWQSGSSTSRSGYLTLAVGTNRDKTAFRCTVHCSAMDEIAHCFHIKVEGSSISSLCAHGHQEKHFQHPQSGTMLAGKQRRSNCNWDFLKEWIWCNPWCYRKETSKGYRDCNCLLSPPAVLNQTQKTFCKVLCKQFVLESSMKQNRFAIVTWHVCFCDPPGTQPCLKQGGQTQILYCSSPLAGTEHQEGKAWGKVNHDQLESSKEGKK